MISYCDSRYLPLHLINSFGLPCAMFTIQTTNDMLTLDAHSHTFQLTKIGSSLFVLRYSVGTVEMKNIFAW